MTEGLIFTQAEVAEMFGISRSRVHQLEKQAMHKLRTRLLEDPVMRQHLADEGFSLPQFPDSEEDARDHSRPQA